MSTVDKGTSVLSDATISANTFRDGVMHAGLKRNEARHQVVGACALYVVETMDRTGQEVDANGVTFMTETLIAGYYNQGQSDNDRAKKIVRTLILKSGTYADTVRREVIAKKSIPTVTMRQIMAGRALEMLHKLTVTTLEKPALLNAASTANVQGKPDADPKPGPVVTVEPPVVTPLADPQVADNTSRALDLLASVVAADVVKAMNEETLATWASAIIAEMEFRKEAAKVPAPASKKAA